MLKFNNHGCRGQSEQEGSPVRWREVKSLWKSGGCTQGGVVSQGRWREGAVQAEGRLERSELGQGTLPGGAGDANKQVNTLSKFAEENRQQVASWECHPHPHREGRFYLQGTVKSVNVVRKGEAWFSHAQTENM